MKLHPWPLLLLILFAFISSVPGIVFLKLSLLYRFFSVCFLNESPDFGRSRKSNTVENNLRTHNVDFKSFSHVMGNWSKKPCISHVVKYTIGWKSDWRKVPILWVKFGYQFPRLSQFGGFHCIFLCYEKLMGKPMHFPCDKVYHRVVIQWEKRTFTVGKVWVTISQVLSHTVGFLDFIELWKIDGETDAFSIWWSIPQNGNLMAKRTHTMEKVWEPISQAFTIRGFLLPFPWYRKSMRKHMHFPYDEVYHRMGI